MKRIINFMGRHHKNMINIAISDHLHAPATLSTTERGLETM